MNTTDKIINELLLIEGDLPNKMDLVEPGWRERLEFEQNNPSTYPDPFIKPFSVRLNHHNTKRVIVRGDFITPDVDVLIDELEVSAVTFVSSRELAFDVTADEIDGFHDVTIVTGSGSRTIENAIEVKLFSWVDLREGGQTFSDGNEAGNDIRYRSGMSIVRDGLGMNFAGANPWGSWVKFESLMFKRGDDKSVTWIMSNPTSAMMIGIGSDATDENNNAQYYQMETLPYLQNSNKFWGVFGNNGTVGQSGRVQQSLTISGYAGLKVTITKDGSQGGQVLVYGLDSLDESEWDNLDNLIGTIDLVAPYAPDEENLFPVVIPRPGTQRLVAVRVE